MKASTRLARSNLFSLPNTYVCWRCQAQEGTRRISQRFLERQKVGREEWKEQARAIRDGKKPSMMSVLNERGFIHDVAGGKKVVENLMTDKRIGVYAGIDPTAPSLHVGHMLPLMALFWMYLHGFHTVSLLGGSTARIGDPTGRTTSRQEMTSTERKANIASIHYQLKKLWVNVERMGRKYGYTDQTHWKRELTNNATWWNKMPFLDVLKYMGKGIRLGPMLTRDTVKRKMESGDGMSFAEFCYPIMQSWDFWRLYEEKGIQMQIGGQDQYGNIVAGIDAVKYIAKSHPDPDIRAPETGLQPQNMPCGITVPLLTTSSGEKFGKSAGNAIWLETQMTSSFDLYGFFVRTADADVFRYLKLFTFIPTNKIDSICDKSKLDPSKRLAQHVLAREFVELIHGEQAAKDAAAQHAALFQKQPNLSSPTASTIEQAPPAPSPDTRSEPQSQLEFNQETSQSQEPSPSDSTDTFDRMPAIAPQKASSAPYNKLQDNQNRTARLHGTYLSPALNPFAPQTAANTPGATASVLLPTSLIRDQPIARVLYAAGLVSSRSEGHRLAAAQGAYIGHESGVSRSDDGKADKKGTEMNDQLTFTPAKLHDKSQTWNYVIKPRESYAEASASAAAGEEGLLILRAGKWKMRVIRVVSDEKFESLGLAPPPGWDEWRAEQIGKKGKEEWADIEEELVAAKKGVEPARREQQMEALRYFRARGMTTEEVTEAVTRVWEEVKRGGRRRRAEAGRARDEEARKMQEALETFEEDAVDDVWSGSKGAQDGSKS